MPLEHENLETYRDVLSSDPFSIILDRGWAGLCTPGDIIDEHCKLRIVICPLYIVNKFIVDPYLYLVMRKVVLPIMIAF